jgi:hypothetical protein
LHEDLSDVAPEAQLFPALALAAIKSRRTQADWTAIHRELKRPGAVRYVGSRRSLNGTLKLKILCRP